MAFGPEFISGLAGAIRKILPLRVNRIEGGEAWAALKISGENWLLFSWTSGAAGISLASQGEINALREISPSRASISEALKSRLTHGGEIYEVKQINHDRVLEFKARRRVSAGLSVNYSLVIEITEPVANFLLLDDKGKIDEAARHSTPDVNHFRTILPGHSYTPPPAFEGITLNPSQALKFEDVQNIKGIGRPLARLVQAHWPEKDAIAWNSALMKALDEDAEVSCKIITKNNYLTRLDFDFPEFSGSQVSNNEKNSADTTRKHEVSAFDGKKSHELSGSLDISQVSSVTKNSIDARNNSQSLTINHHSSRVSDALEIAKLGVIVPLLRRGREKVLHEIDAKIKRAVKSRERHRDGLIKQLKECEEAEVFRLKGEAILSHIYEIPKRAENVVLTDWEGNELKISLDPELSPSRNAEKYFKRYRKAKGNPDEIKSNLEAIKSAIQELNEQHALLEAIDNPEDFNEAVKDLSEWISPEPKKANPKRKKNSPEVPPHLSINFEGVNILVGLSARGNRYVTLKAARPEDIWLHAHEMPGAHVIIRGVKRQELEGSRRKVLEYAASLAAGHSSGKEAGSVPIDYTERKYVRSVPGTVALVTYTNPGTLRITPKK